MAEKKKKIMLTGDRPTGRLHIGHYVGSLRQRLELQEDPSYDKIFVMLFGILMFFKLVQS